MPPTMSADYFSMYSGGMFSNSTPDDLMASPVKKLDKSEALIKARSLLETKAIHVDVPPVSDDFILRFLNARKMNIENCVQLMLNYFDHRKKNPALFENLTVNDPLTQSCLRDGLPLVLKNRDRKGRCVVLFLIYSWDHSKYSIETIYKALLLTMEYLLEDIQNQVNGFVFAVDWTNFKLRDYIDVSPKMVKLMVDGFQDAFPSKFKGLHFIGQPWYVDGIITVIKSFLKEKTKQKFIVHGSNLSSLHEYLPRDVLPPELGGEGTAYRTDEWIELLKNYENRTSLQS
ncbi:clavesin-2-like [Planococcus citri]|uniref:clavesin-2-like n=1 Tax=Planococcus citri TaxID=170843 RepID=UPI0031F8CABC